MKLPTESTMEQVRNGIERKQIAWAHQLQPRKQVGMELNAPK